MKNVPLTSGRLAIGRSSAVELSFPEDAGLSRQHFAFESEGEDWTVQDLGSKNGTFVNNIPLKARLILKPGDRITAGHLVIVYSPDDADPNAGVVVFEGSEASPTTSTVVTSLEGALSNQTMAIERGGPKASAPLQALLKFGEQLSQYPSLEDMLPATLELAIQAVNAQRGVLMLLENEQLVVKAHKGEGFRISSTVRDRAVNEKASILVRDAQLDDAFKGRMSIVEQKVHTMMAVPLQTKERIIGLIYVEDRKKGPVMGFHMWVEAWVSGQWVSLDPTFGPNSVGATHLKIADHSWFETPSLAPLLPIARVLGKLKIEVVSTDKQN